MTAFEGYIQKVLAELSLGGRRIERAELWLRERLDRIRAGLRRAGMSDAEAESTATGIMGHPDTLADDAGRRFGDRWWLCEVWFWVSAALAGLAGAAYFALRWASPVPILLCLAIAICALTTLKRRKPTLEQGLLAFRKSTGGGRTVDLARVERVGCEGDGRRSHLALQVGGKVVRVAHCGRDRAGLAAEILAGVPESAQIDVAVGRLLQPRAQAKHPYRLAGIAALAVFALFLAIVGRVWRIGGPSWLLGAPVVLTGLLAGFPKLLYFRQRPARITAGLTGLALFAQLLVLALMVDSREREAMVVAIAFAPILLLLTGLFWMLPGLSRRAAVVAMVFVTPLAAAFGWGAGLPHLPPTQRLLAVPGFSIEKVSFAPGNRQLFLAAAALPDPAAKESKARFVVISRDMERGRTSRLFLGYGTGSMSLSPDGSRLAATMVERGKSSLYLLGPGLEATTPALVTDGAFFWPWRGILDPWSPGGGRLLFVEESKHGVYTKCLDIKSWEVFTLPVMGFNNPVVWLSEERICFMKAEPTPRGKEGRFVAAEVRYDGSGYKEVFEADGLRAWALFPEQQAVLLHREDQSLIILRLGMWEDARTMAGFPEFAFLPWQAAVSSDLRFLAYPALVGERVAVRLVDLRNDWQEDVFSASHGGISELTFAPGSHLLAFSWPRPRERSWEDKLIYVFDCDKGTLLRIGSRAFAPSEVAPAPVGGLYWSPDGRRLLWGAPYLHVGAGGVSMRMALWEWETSAADIP